MVELKQGMKKTKKRPDSLGEPPKPEEINDNIAAPQVVLVDDPHAMVQFNKRVPAQLKAEFESLLEHLNKTRKIGEGEVTSAMLLYRCLEAYKANLKRQKKV